MSTTSSQPNPTIHGRHEESGNPTPTTSRPYPNAIPLTDLRSFSQVSVHSSAPTAPPTTPAPNPPAQPTQGNVQAAPVKTWYQSIWAYVRKTLTSWCTACGPPQLLLGLVGLGLSIVVLKLAIYSYQLSRWTAWKDFRQDCRSLNVSLQLLSDECQDALSQPLTVPPHISLTTFIERNLVHEKYRQGSPALPTQHILAAALFASTTVAFVLVVASLWVIRSSFGSYDYSRVGSTPRFDSLSIRDVGGRLPPNISNDGGSELPLSARADMSTMRMLRRLWRHWRPLPAVEDPSSLAFQEPDPKVRKSTGAYWGVRTISNVESDLQEKPWAVLERWRLEKDCTNPTTRMARPWSRIRKTKVVSIQAFQGGQHQLADDQRRISDKVEDSEDLDHFQKCQVDRLVERKTEEYPGFEWSLVGAQMFSTIETQPQSITSEGKPRAEDYLDVSIRGMAHEFANLSNYHEFEQLILNRHLGKSHLIELAAGRPRSDQGHAAGHTRLDPLEEEMPATQKDGEHLVQVHYLQDEHSEDADTVDRESPEIGVVKGAQFVKTYETRDLLYGFAKGLDMSTPPPKPTNLLRDNSSFQASDAPEDNALENNALEHEAYLSRLHRSGERMTELHAELKHLVQEETNRALDCLNLDEEGQAFLDQFDARHDVLLREFTIAQHQASLASKAFFVDDYREYFLDTQFDTCASPQNLDADFTEALFEDPVFPVDLLVTETDDFVAQEPLFSLIFLESHSFDADGGQEVNGSFSTPTFINQWLLHKLRVSRFEIRAFKSFHKIKFNFSEEKLKDLVLAWWFKDGTNAFTSKARRSHIRGSSIPLSSNINDPNRDDPNRIVIARAMTC